MSHDIERRHNLVVLCLFCKVKVWSLHHTSVKQGKRHFLWFYAGGQKAVKQDQQKADYRKISQVRCDIYYRFVSTMACCCFSIRMFPEVATITKYVCTESPTSFSSYPTVTWHRDDPKAGHCASCWMNIVGALPAETAELRESNKAPPLCWRTLCNVSPTFVPYTASIIAA